MVKQLSLSIVFAIFIALSSSAQSGAAFNTTGSPADPSSMLDVSSTTQGILIPRMTESQKNLISNPATGLMIYQTDGTTGFWYFDGSVWKQSLGITGATGATGSTGLLTAGSNIGNTPYWDGSQWVVNSSNIYNDGTSVGIGTSSPDASAFVDITSPDKGLLIPRMSTTARNNIASPAQGLLLYNTTTNCLEIHINSLWQSVYCGCNAPNAPITGTHSPSQTEIVWNWNAVSGATGYKYNTINDYASATDNGNSTTYTQTGLACNTTYYMYVWSYSSCSNSSVTTLSQTTSSCWAGCGNALTISHTAGSVAPETKVVSYGTVNSSLSGASKCWITRNLGATSQATSAIDATDNAAGWFWQFNRKQGYKTGPYPAWTITSISESSDWLLTNDPCAIELGTGWRIPTSTEWSNADANGSWNSYTQTYSSVLKLHAAGYLNSPDGATDSRGLYGIYVSSTSATNNYSNSIFASSSYVQMDPTMNKAYGCPLRCIKD